MKGNEVIPTNILNLISPFYFIMGEELLITSAGNGIQKICPQIVGSQFKEMFAFKRPFSINYTFDSIISYTKQIFILDYLGSELILRGQIIFVEHSNELIFVGSPWVTNVHDLEKYNLLITDFALHDTTPDLLHVFQTQEIAMKEIKLLVQNLNKQKKELNKSRSLYKQLVEEAGDIIIRADNKGIITYINPIGLRILKLEEGDLLDKHISSLVELRYQEIAMELFERQLSQRVLTRYQEFPLKMKSGESLWFGHNINLIMDGDMVVGVQLVARDVTERKKFEEELVKAKELAEESERAKEKFLANMSHEIRTPMNAIYGLTNILMESKLNEEDKESVRAINQSATNLIRIINDILDFSKIESGSVKLERRSFGLRNVLEEVDQTLRLVAKNKGLEMSTHVENVIPDNLIGDEVRLRQVLLNLQSNAIKFTEQGMVSTKVRIKEKTPHSCLLEFQVIDTGIGIPKDKSSLIFKSFTQASDDTSRKYGGTGLGLTIAKELVDIQSGTIGVESEFGKGSCFTFTIPFGIDRGTKDAAKADLISYHLNELSSFQFLMAEDNVMNQFLAKKVFGKWNCAIDFAQNGQEAVDMLKAKDYDLILMDLQMPEMDGYQATKHIREQLNGPKASIPIIAITAHALAGESDKCIAIGMNDYISKPFDREVLFEKLIKHLNINRNLDD